jgi:hypothetical protein
MKTGVPSKKAQEYLLKCLGERKVGTEGASLAAIADEAVRRFGFEPQDREGYVKVPHALLEDRSLSPVARLVAMDIASYAFVDKTEAWPSDQTVANALGISIPSVRRAKTELRKCVRAWVKPTGHRKYNGPAIVSVAAIKAETEKRV